MMRERKYEFSRKMKSVLNLESMRQIYSLCVISRKIVEEISGFMAYYNSFKKFCY